MTDACAICAIEPRREPSVKRIHLEFWLLVACWAIFALQLLFNLFGQ